ncbi:hypothetical protein ACE1CD_10390 [Aerosakkonema sp. BLCC-F183]
MSDWGGQCSPYDLAIALSIPHPEKPLHLIAITPAYTYLISS